MPFLSRLHQDNSFSQNVLDRLFARGQHEMSEDLIQEEDFAVITFFDKRTECDDSVNKINLLRD